MPSDMFQVLVSPGEPSTRRRYLLPLSVIIHLVLLGTAIVVPLLATDVLPTPRSMLGYVAVVAPPSLPAAAPVRENARVPKQGVPQIITAAPIEAPAGVGPEPDINLGFGHVSPGVPGVPDGLLGGVEVNNLVEAPPIRVTAPQPVRPGGKIKPPSRISGTAPVYPAVARTTRVEGDVLIEAIIAPDGTVREARILRSIRLLDEAALDAVRSWTYTPTLLNGEPVPVILTVTVRFRLN